MSRGEPHTTSELKELLALAATNIGELPEGGMRSVCVFSRDDHEIEVRIIPSFVRSCRRQREWLTKRLLATMLNVRYGYDAQNSRSRGGRDGIFRVDREHRPKNSMIRELHDRFLNDPEGAAQEVGDGLGTSTGNLLAVRVVSHHMRLLGVLKLGTTKSVLVLIGVDRTKS